MTVIIRTDRLRIRQGDCLVLMGKLADNSIDSIVTDPPYGLGFMGKAWDELPPGLPWAQECLRVLKPGGHILAFGGTRTWHRLAVAIEDAGFEMRDSIAWLYGSGFPKGKGVLKPAFEPIVMARKKAPAPWLNVDACRIQYVSDADRDQTRVPTPIQYNDARGVYMSGTGVGRTGEIFQPAEGGRWPANVVLDEAMADVLDEQSGTKMSRGHTPARRGADRERSVFGGFNGQDAVVETHGEATGGASRFFYVAKAPAKERPKVDGVAHPTVKPLTLMRWLVKLVTPPNGIVLDPFLGSGTTAQAALLEGFQCFGIERDESYIPLIMQRLKFAIPDESPVAEVAI